MRSIFIVSLCSFLVLFSSCNSRWCGNADENPTSSNVPAAAKTDGEDNGHSSAHEQHRNDQLVDHDVVKKHEQQYGHQENGHQAHVVKHGEKDKHHPHVPPMSEQVTKDHAAHADHESGHSSDMNRGSSGLDESPAEFANLSAAEIFNRRILPILRSDKESSCTECHFGGVELQNYIHEDQATTFASLRDEGLIDVKSPDKSKLLAFIARSPDKEDPLLAKVRQTEYQAFRAWINAAVRQPELLASKTDEKVGTELPVEVVRHLRRDRVLQSFVENIWSEMGRCINCHSPERNARLVKKHGDQVSWIVPRDPAATLERLVEGGNIDTEYPDDSPLVLKPAGLQDHGGGPKFAVGSRTDKNFRRFLNDYAAVVGGKYKRTEQLPEPSQEVTARTSQHLRIVDLPAELNKKLLRTDIYRRIGSGWSDTPWGTAENPINGEKNMWQSMVFFVAPRDSRRAEQSAWDKEMQLPAGRYLIKIYIDRDDKTKKDRDYELGDADFFGQVEFDGQWQPGYQPPKTIQAPAAR